jgi:hypothetical protein
MLKLNLFTRCTEYSNKGWILNWFSYHVSSNSKQSDNIHLRMQDIFLRRNCAAWAYRDYTQAGSNDNLMCHDGLSPFVAGICMCLGNVGGRAGCAFRIAESDVPCISSALSLSQSGSEKIILQHLRVYLRRNCPGGTGVALNWLRRVKTKHTHALRKFHTQILKFV